LWLKYDLTCYDCNLEKEIVTNTSWTLIDRHLQRVVIFSDHQKTTRDEEHSYYDRNALKIGGFVIQVILVGTDIYGVFTNEKNFVERALSRANKIVIFRHLPSFPGLKCKGSCSAWVIGLHTLGRC